MKTPRRTFLKNGLWLLSAPTVIKAQNIMPGPIMRPIAAAGGTTLKTDLVEYWALDNNFDGSHDSKALTDTGSAAFGNTVKMAGTHSLHSITGGGYSSDAAFKISGLNAFSASLWLYMNSDVSGTFPWDRWGGSADRIWCLYGSGTNAATFFVRALDDSGNVGTSAMAISQSAWHHIAFGYDPGASGSEVWMYVDGVAATAGNQADGLRNSTPNMYIAEAATAPSAEIDECAFWSRRITPAEVASIYNSGTGLFYASW